MRNKNVQKYVLSTTVTVWQKNIQLRLSVQCLADFHKEFRRKKNLNAFFIPSQYRLKIFSRNLFEVLTTILRH